jgi:hypothetical protein
METSKLHSVSRTGTVSVFIPIRTGILVFWLPSVQSTAFNDDHDHIGGDDLTVQNEHPIDKEVWVAAIRSN